MFSGTSHWGVHYYSEVNADPHKNKIKSYILLLYLDSLLLKRKIRGLLLYYMRLYMTEKLVDLISCYASKFGGSTAAWSIVVFHTNFLPTRRLLGSGWQTLVKWLILVRPHFVGRFLDQCSKSQYRQVACMCGHFATICNGRVKFLCCCIFFYAPTYSGAYLYMKQVSEKVLGQ